jgi:hypothetical protein
VRSSSKGVRALGPSVVERIPHFSIGLFSFAFDRDGQALSQAFEHAGDRHLVFAGQCFGQRVFQDVLDGAKPSPVVYKPLVVLSKLDWIVPFFFALV